MKVICVAALLAVSVTSAGAQSARAGKREVPSFHPYADQLTHLLELSSTQRDTVTRILNTYENRVHPTRAWIGAQSGKADRPPSIRDSVIAINQARARADTAIRRILTPSQRVVFDRVKFRGGGS